MHAIGKLICIALATLGVGYAMTGPLWLGLVFLVAAIVFVELWLEAFP